ncbi:MAG TPA: transposase [Streptosporangiaceae bacterium]|nr:transposase [Streptosporangiaceae bacterium]
MTWSAAHPRRSGVPDQVWQLIGPLLPPPKPIGRSPVDQRAVVEAMAWRLRTGAPWRDLPDRFGNWNTIYRNSDRWARDDYWVYVLEHVQSVAHARGETLKGSCPAGAATPGSAVAWSDRPPAHRAGIPPGRPSTRVARRA